MTKLSLEEIKSLSLDILTDVDSFCRQNGIRYSLAYGSLIGAARHKGFIPWDDDIDIVMLRPEYERFMASYRSDRFVAVDHKTDSDCQIEFGRVADTVSTVCYSLIPWIKNKQYGLWIDIFPLDRTEDDEQGFRKAYDAVNALKIQNNKLRRNHAVLHKEMPLWMKLKLIKRHFLHSRIKGTIPEKLAGMDAIIAEQAAKGGRFYAQFCDTDLGYEHIPEEMLQEYTDLPFEDRKFMAFAEYDRILRASFGDYMQLPPPEKRVPLQSGYMVFCWK